MVFRRKFPIERQRNSTAVHENQPKLPYRYKTLLSYDTQYHQKGPDSFFQSIHSIKTLIYSLFDIAMSIRLEFLQYDIIRRKTVLEIN